MRGWIAASLAAGLLVTAAARAETEAFAPRGSGFEESAGAALFGGGAPGRMSLSPPLSLPPDFGFESFEDPLGGGGEEPASPKKPKWVWIGAAAAATIGGSLYNALSEQPHFPFHFTKEGWFGQGTYAGGADKMSHFVSYWGVTLIMNEVNKAFGAQPDQALLLATGLSFVTGIATEIGDGYNKYGFSWEDLTMDTLGAATALAVTHYGLRDLIGFRIGLVPAPDSPVGGLGKDYSQEIYTADLKIEGLGRRMRFNPGPARFLLFSVSYGVKGYPYAPPEDRSRLVGFEIGLNFGQIMQALGVPRHKWWGVCLYTLFDIVRFPYTAWGFRYDLNNGQWYGPDTGQTYPMSPQYGGFRGGARR